MSTERRETASAPNKSIRSRLIAGESPITNFTGEKAAMFKFTAKVCGQAAKPGNKINGEVIDLKYYYVHTVPMLNDRTGDEVDSPRCVLVSKDGTMWRWVSHTIIDALDNLIAVYGPGPYDEPVQFTVIEGESKRGSKIYSFDPVD